nr:unnamed protein product [Digitaria exilis]
MTTKRSHNQQHSKKQRDRGPIDRISALPDEILLAILNDVDAKTAVSTSLLSRRWRYLWTSLHSLHLSDVSFPANYRSWVRLGPMNKDYLKSNRITHFVPSLRWFARRIKKGDTDLRRLSLVFSGDARSAAAVNSAIGSAADQGVKDIAVAVVGKTEYKFPLCLFSYGDSSSSSSSLDSLWLNNCKISVSLVFEGFSALRKLVLVAMRMSVTDTEVLVRSCRSLKSLYLIDMVDARVAKHPGLEELVWLWPHPYGALTIDAPALRSLEYCGAGEVLPASTRKSLPCLEHVSLQYVVYGDHPDRHAKNLRTIATRFPHVKSLHLRYQVPKFVVKPGTPAVFSKLRALTLSIDTKPSDDLFWMVMFVAAAPYLATLQTNVRYLSFLESRNGVPNGVEWDVSNFEHNSLKEVEMYNFEGRDNEIGFARLLLQRAPSIRRIAFSHARLPDEAVYHQCIPPDWPKAQEFSPRDNRSVLSRLLDGDPSGASVVFM